MGFIIGTMIIIIGSILLNITFHDELAKTTIYQMVGLFIMWVGIVCLRKFTRLGKKQNRSPR